MAGTVLEEKVEALRVGTELATGRLPGPLLDEAARLLERAGERSALSGSHTVVAFAGATGSGKSSLFNAVAELDLARVGARRPTTSTPLACVWGPEGAGPLLDWLEIPSRHQVVRESPLDAGAQADLTGLVLLDLPDHDSTEVAHRVEVDRVVALADLLVWVLDPQKYADDLVHTRYLRRLTGYAEVVVVVLNQVDRLSAAERQHCLAHLRRLLVDDGLAEVPLLATSAVTGEGIVDLRRRLRAAVRTRQAAEARTSADLADVASRMQAVLDGSAPASPDGAWVSGELTVAARPAAARAPARSATARPGGGFVARLGRGGSRDQVDSADRERLVDALGVACGVPAVVDAVGHAYAHRSRQATGWPLVRWLGRLRPDPLKRLRVDRSDVAAEVLRSSLPPPTPAQRAAAAAAVRVLGDAAAARFDGAAGPGATAGSGPTAGPGHAGPPRPVVQAVQAVTRRAGEQLPDRLDQAVASTDLEGDRVPWWWRVLGVLQWLGTLLLIVGAVWLLALFVVSFTTLPRPDVPDAAGVAWPVLLLVGGVVLGLLLAWLARVLTAVGARRASARAQRRLRAAVRTVADEVVVAPVQAELGVLDELRQALALASR